MRINTLLYVITKQILPYIIIFGLYLQIYGSDSPGGGFQAGMIMAAAFFLYSLVFGRNKLSKILPESSVSQLMTLGILIYGGTGLYAIFKGGEFLNYYYLASDKIGAQKLGIHLVELGVGLAVLGVAVKIFYQFTRALEND